jgi:hypothetical protein
MIQASVMGYTFLKWAIKAAVNGTKVVFFALVLYVLTSDYSPYQQHASLVVTHWTTSSERSLRQTAAEPIYAN